jgi:hypothetical protein
MAIHDGENLDAFAAAGGTNTLTATRGNVRHNRQFGELSSTGLEIFG